MLMAGAVRGIGDIYGLSFVGLEEWNENNWLGKNFKKEKTYQFGL
jgi:hypothetical protein